MVLTDKGIRELQERLITPFRKDNVSNTCYDLTTEAFCQEVGHESTVMTLTPGESVFVKAEESICLPADMLGIVSLRNSRIRQGLNLSAPIYQPGHHTKVFFRITNISQSNIELRSDDASGMAAIMFVRLDEAVEKPYEGAFQKEFDFRGMGKYSSDLSRGMMDIEKKVDDIRNMEKNIYANVLSILAIFVAIFSLINVNVSLLTKDIRMISIIVINLATIGSIGFLIALINTVLPEGHNKKIAWIACAASFVAALVIQLLFG